MPCSLFNSDRLVAYSSHLAVQAVGATSNLPNNRTPENPGLAVTYVAIEGTDDGSGDLPYFWFRLELFGNV